MMVSIAAAGIRATSIDLIDAAIESNEIGDVKLAAVTLLAALIPMEEADNYFLARWKMNSCFKSLNSKSLPNPTHSRNTSNATSRTVHFVSRQCLTLL